MPFTLELPDEYGYVLLTATATFFVSAWHGMRISRFRKAAGRTVAFPVQYATNQDIAAADSAEQKQKLYLFNCAQRAHYNFLENYTTALSAMMIAGLKYPKAAAATGVAWSAFRVAYAVGYTRKDKENGSGRLVGSSFWFCQLALAVMAGMTGYQMLV